MKQLTQIEKELEKLQNELVSMLAKFAIVLAVIGIILCVLAKQERVLVFSITMVFILSVGLFLFKKWYTRYKALRRHFFDLENDYKKLTNDQIKEAKEAMDGLLYIRRF